MPNNPTSASFPEFLPFCAFESQRWRQAVETASLCQLHTIYRHPGRFGTAGLFFYKLENRIAGMCSIKQPHLNPQEAALHHAAVYARFQTAIIPVSNPLRFFDSRLEKKGANNKDVSVPCYVPTLGPCYDGYSTPPLSLPGVFLEFACLRMTLCTCPKPMLRWLQCQQYPSLGKEFCSFY